MFKVPGTDMDIITLVFIAVEIVVLFGVYIAEKSIKKGNLNLLLLFFLIIYNITGGLFPDYRIPINYKLQNVIAYGTGFLTPCFFPYYAYKSFGIDELKFHAFKGIYIFIAFPYFIFIGIYVYSGKLEIAEYSFIPVLLYAIWVARVLIVTIIKKIKKRKTKFKIKDILIVFAIVPWVTLPLIIVFSLSQATEAIITNLGFLLLMCIQIKEHIHSAQKKEDFFLNYNNLLKVEVDNKTIELQLLNEKQRLQFISIANEVKTPLTLINHYLNEYIETSQIQNGEINFLKTNLDWLEIYIANFLSLKEIPSNVNNSTKYPVNLSEVLALRSDFFKKIAKDDNVSFITDIDDDIIVNGTKTGLDRIILNLIEIAFRLSDNSYPQIRILLGREGNNAIIRITDNGIGLNLKEKNGFLNNSYETNAQNFPNNGINMGLHIVKLLTSEIGASFEIENYLPRGNQFIIKIPLTTTNERPLIIADKTSDNLHSTKFSRRYHLPIEVEIDPKKICLLLVDSNVEILTYWHRKLIIKYNILLATSGTKAIEKLNLSKQLPVLIITELHLPKLSGILLIKFLSDSKKFNKIPVIALSSNSEFKIQDLPLNTIDLIQKPFSFGLLESNILRILKLVEMSKVAQKSNVSNDILPQVKNIIYPDNITKREQQIIAEILKGNNTITIAKMLFLSETTIKKHISNIYIKLHLKSRSELFSKFSYLN